MSGRSAKTITGALIQETAKAKVNLYLHVTGKRADGYHELDSLAVFPDIGDQVSASLSDKLTCQVDGPFSAGLGATEDNLVLKAAKTLAQYFGVTQGADLCLTKNLPVASGIGGGSADAAATLRALIRLWGLAPTRDELEDIALTLGADVPVCLNGTATFMGGIGEKLTKVDSIPALGIVLVNPGIAVSTPDVFTARTGPFDAEALFDASFYPKGADFIDVLAKRRNALEAPALSTAPEIGDVLGALSGAEGVKLARMSGSGATCFGLTESNIQAEQVREMLSSTHPEWWVAAGVIS